MINLIIGKKGTGKTKRIIKLAQDALHQATGQVVFIDDDKRCMSELNYKIRFINTTEFALTSADDLYGFIAGMLITLIPMIVGYIFARKICKLHLLNTLGSITGGMTSTPALGTLISVAETDDVAGAYASTYPIALVLIVFACQIIGIVC